jgi:2-polyprenyl-3-methyl-5-hydroxy-6-metoxy-1,4-benzoquinol methylase
MFRQLQEINTRPAPFEQCTVADLWTDEHTSSQMLAFHLDGSVDLSSRNTEFIDRSARWIVSRFDLDQSKCVADFGCGPGLYTTRLAASGAAVTGIDFSHRSLRYARESSERQSLSVEYVHADYLEYETSRRFDLIAMIMCDFCALSPPQRRTMLDKFLALLKPGGSVLLDVYSLHAFDEREEIATYAPGLLDGFWSSKPYFGFLNTFKHQAEKVTLDKYTIFEETRTRVIYNWLQHFDREALGKEFENSAFVVEEFPGDVAGAAFDPESQEFAIVARKPA